MSSVITHRIPLYGNGATLDLPWAETITGVGPPTVGYVSELAGVSGGIELALEATSEVQNASLHWGDSLTLDIRRLKYVEFLVDVTVALGTTAATTQFAFGLASERNDAIDSIAEAILFRCLGSTTVVYEYDDGTNTADDQSTGGLTLSTSNGPKRFGIDFREGVDKVQLKMDNDDGYFETVATGLDMSAYTAATGGLQPYAQIQKAANTDVGTIVLADFLRLDLETDMSG